jgi:uncharacterized membrane protein (UPF0127 family)
MTRNKTGRIFVVLSAIFILAGCAKTLDQNVITIETAQGPRVFHIEIADTEPEQNKGLMDRKSMPQDAGMLFVFGKEDDWSFWMKNTLIPLDLLFLARDGTIHHIHRMARPLDETHIVAENPSKAVLEINGGLADTLGIAEGDKAIHPVFRNQLDE